MLTMFRANLQANKETLNVDFWGSAQALVELESSVCVCVCVRVPFGYLCW